MKNNGTPYGDSLAAAYNASNPKPMLAGLVKFVLAGRRTRPAEMRFAFQPYQPRTGANMTPTANPWLAIWYNPSKTNY